MCCRSEFCEVLPFFHRSNKFWSPASQNFDELMNNLDESVQRCIVQVLQLTVSCGSFESCSMRALYICSPVPSKNFPQPA